MTDDLLCATVSVRDVIQNTHGEVLTVQRRSDHAWELPGRRLSQGSPPRRSPQSAHREWSPAHEWPRTLVVGWAVGHADISPVQKRARTARRL